MSVVAWPETCIPYEFTLSRYTKVFRGTSAYGKSGQNVDMLNDRWKISCTIGLRSADDSPELEAFVNGLRSGASTTTCYHFKRPYIRGVLTNPLTQTMSKGAQNLSITCAIGDYLKAGDMLGINDQLFQVALDCTSTTTTLTVPVTLRSRDDIVAGLSVTTVKPTGNFRLLGTASTSYSPSAVIMDTTLEFVEVI